MKLEHIKDDMSAIYNSKHKIKHSVNVLSSNEDLKSLWTACYFDRKLSKPMIQAMDLRRTMFVIKQLLQKETIDFRTVAPMMLGLVKIFYKQLNYLMSEAQTTISRVRNPF
jgi:hypothetical protein